MKKVIDGKFIKREKRRFKVYINIYHGESLGYISAGIAFRSLEEAQKNAVSNNIDTFIGTIESEIEV